MKGLLEEAHGYLERARDALEIALAEAVGTGRGSMDSRLNDLADAVDDLASRVSNLVNEVRSGA